MVNGFYSSNDSLKHYRLMVSFKHPHFPQRDKGTLRSSKYTYLQTIHRYILARALRGLATLTKE